MNLRRMAGAALSAAFLAAAPAIGAEIDVQLTTTLPGVRAVQLEVVPVEKGPSSSLSLKAPTDVKISGGEKVEGLFAPFSTGLPGLYRYFVDVVIFGENGEELASGDDDDVSDSTPIVDIFIDTDCEDCGDYDFTVPTPPGGNPGTIDGHLELLNSDGDARFKITTRSWDTGTEKAHRWPEFSNGWATVTLLSADKTGAPIVLQTTTTVPLDKTTLEFSDDLIFKDGEPANLAYRVYATWLDEKGSPIGQKEVFETTAAVAKQRKDGTYVYKPWRFHSDLSEVVGETWDVEAVTDTYLDAAAFRYTLTPTNGGPKLDPATRVMKTAQYVQKGQARDVTIGGALKAEHTWTFQARLLDANGKPLAASAIVSGEAIMDDGEGLVVKGSDVCRLEPLNCIPGVRIRYSDMPSGTEPDAVWVTSTRFQASALATTLELIQIPEKGTGPMLKQAGQEKAGYLLLPVDTSRVIFESDLTLVLAPGTPDDAEFTYDLRTGWLNADDKLMAAEETEPVRLRRLGNGLDWTYSRVGRITPRFKR